MVFGEALIRAYELENNVVRFPRVMVTRDVMQDIDESNSGLFAGQPNIYRPHIEQADDGPHYVHVLRMVQSTVAKLQTENLN